LLSENLNSLKKVEKKDSIKLLPSICKGFNEVSPFLSRILTILQCNIADENGAIFPTISTSFGELVENSIKGPLEDNKTKYELFQGFCIYNMKQEVRSNQICGALCLTSLIETCPLVLNTAYMKYIWENTIHFIDRPTFYAKSELLNALISLIFAAESLFKSFATVTLYKILDFLTDSDAVRRKLALNVVYTLIIYCQEEIVPLKGHIVEFLRVLKTDKVKEVREVCMQTLKLFNEHMENDIQQTNVNEEKVIIQSKASKDNTSRDTPRDNRKKNQDNHIKVLKSTSLNTKNKEVKQTNYINNTITEGNTEKPIEKLERNNRSFIKNISSIDLNVNDNIDNDLSVDFISPHLKKDKSSVTFDNRIKVVKRKDNEKKTSYANKILNTSYDAAVNAIDKANKQNKTNKQNNPSNTKPIRNKILDESHNDTLNISAVKTVENIDIPTMTHVNSKREIKVNRRDDNTFVNSKMVIKRDPSYSIFKTKANLEFFKKPSKEIEVVYKDNTSTINNDKIKVAEENINSLNPSNNLNAFNTLNNPTYENQVITTNDLLVNAFNTLNNEQVEDNKRCENLPINMTGNNKSEKIEKTENFEKTENANKLEVTDLLLSMKMMSDVIINNKIETNIPFRYHIKASRRKE
jgi:hypothetical protein